MGEEYLQRHFQHGTAGMAAVDWDAVITTLDNGRLTASGGEQRIIRIAASLTPGTLSASATPSPASASTACNWPSPQSDGLPDSTRDRHLDVAHAETLQFIAQWLASGPAALASSLLTFIGHPAYGPDGIRADLNRFAVLLGGSGGETLLEDR